MIDDVDMENGPMMVVPGSHKGRSMTIMARTDGSAARWTRKTTTSTSLAPSRASARPGSITIHHVRAVHGSATNFSGKERRFLLYQYRAADAWPLLGLKEGIENFNEQLIWSASRPSRRGSHVAGADAAAAGRDQGSIYENQRASRPPLFRDPRRDSPHGCGVVEDVAAAIAHSPAQIREPPSGGITAGTHADGTRVDDASSADGTDLWPQRDELSGDKPTLNCVATPAAVRVGHFRTFDPHELEQQAPTPRRIPAVEGHI